MAERLGNRAINQKVAGSIPGHAKMKLCPWARHFTQLASGECPCNYCSPASFGSFGGLCSWGSPNGPGDFEGPGSSSGPESPGNPSGLIVVIVCSSTHQGIRHHHSRP